MLFLVMLDLCTFVILEQNVYLHGVKEGLAGFLHTKLIVNVGTRSCDPKTKYTSVRMYIDM